MEFFGIGPLELLVILAITLMVVGPKRLPEMAAELARFVRTIQKYANSVRQEFSETMQDIEREYDDMKGEWKEIGQGLDDTVKPVADTVKHASDEAGRSLADDAKEPASSEPASRPQS
jgi:sec-independent protein translocase protein TatB